MNNEIENLSQTLVELYTKNLAFLEKEFNPLYNQIITLSDKIENGQIEEQYTLEYQNGYFDILNHNQNGGYFYAKNSFIDADERAAVADFDMKNSLDLLRKDPNTKKLLISEKFKDVVPIIKNINETVDFNNVSFEKIYKCIHIGVGLGIHIQEIEKKYNSRTLLIIEENIEIFRLSLFITDYSVFQSDNKRLFLSIGNESLERMKVLQLFSDCHKYMNYNIKYTNFLISGTSIKDEIINFYAGYDIGSFPYRFVLQNLERLVGFIKNSSRFLDTNLMRGKLILKDKRVLVIGAGPSLDSYIKWIREHQNKFIIVATDVILKKLEKNFIIPHIVVSIDPSELCAGYLTTEDPEFLNNTAILLLSQQSQKTMDAIKNKNYYFSQVLNLIPELGYIGSSPNVGTFSFELAAYLGANEIYLIGTDAAFDQETGSRYSTDSSYGIEMFSTTNKDESYAVNVDGVIEVRGNLRETVKTNRTLYAFKGSFEEAVVHYEHFTNSKLEGFNLSDGAYIEGFAPCTKDEINKRIENFKILEFDTINALDSITVVIKEIKYKKEDLLILNSIIQKIKKFLKIKITSKDYFLEIKIDTMIWVLEQTKKMHSGVYGMIFLEYTALVDIYINFLLNLKQRGLHTKEVLTNMGNMWAKGALVMFKDIKKALDS